MLTNLDDVKKDLKTLFESQPLAVLATHGDGKPYTNLVAFASSEDVYFLLFATTRATRKYANLSANPRVSLLIDNRSNRPSDFRHAMAVTATGRAEEVNKEKEAGLLQVYLKKHPHLEDFVTAPSCALLKVKVDAYYLVKHFQSVMEVHMPS
jgi:nitroimidazol reductase NimA-like FMN-containing flavoprotein (pyridoxamine 5'-phosphate oxidase superfamily)